MTTATHRTFDPLADAIADAEGWPEGSACSTQMSGQVTHVADAARSRAMTTEAGGAHAVWAFTEHEHRDLVRGINRIHDVACAIGRQPTPELSVHVLDILRWLDGTLEPHIAWEEAWLYPDIDARLGTPWATRAAQFDHRQIREMVANVRADQGSLSRHEAGDQPAQMRCHLFGLEALVRAHIEREERFLIPLLDEDRRPVQPEAG